MLEGVDVHHRKLQHSTRASATLNLGSQLQLGRDVVEQVPQAVLGHPALTDFVTDGVAGDEAIALVAGVKQLSEHPIGFAIVEGAKAHHPTPGTAAAFETANGLGVQAEIAGKTVLVDSCDFLAQEGIDPQFWEARAEARYAEAKTMGFLAVTGLATGIAAVADPNKESAPGAIAKLFREKAYALPA